ncbi:hypothetical protein BV898_05816 [Hypsibius exemplaris]|uniref:Uncharacterized protein n=1 Tax=Hypsibius exemplaris TaxID=2072580 RepID=A0A1W0WYM9_HYPEX|nr:hypothetical protein BV898_05816 [Hypsibius exemplaris]
MVKKSAASKNAPAFRNRQNPPGLNPTAQPFLPTAATSKPPTTAAAPLNPAAPTFIPKTPSLSESSVVVVEPILKTSAVPPAGGANSNGGAVPPAGGVTVAAAPKTVKLEVPSGKKKSATTQNGASVTPEKAVADSNDGHLTDGGSSSFGNYSESGRQTPSVRASMSKSQRRRNNRNKKSQSFEAADLPTSESGHSDREGAISSSGGSSSGEKAAHNKTLTPGSPTKKPASPLVVRESEECATFTMAVPSLKKDLAEAAVAAESGQGDRAAAEVKELQRQLKLREKELKTTEAVAAERDSLKKQVADFEVKWKVHANTIAELNAIQKKATEMDTRLKKYTAQLDEVKEEKRRLAIENVDLREAAAAKEADLRKALAGSEKAAQQKNAEWEEKLTAAGGELNALRDKLIAAEKTASAATTSYNQLKETTKSLEEQSDSREIKKELEALRKDFDAKSKKADLAEHQVQQLRENTRKLESDLDGLKIKLVRIDALERYTGDLEAQLRDASVKVKEAELLRSKLAESEEKIKAKDAHYQTLLASRQQNGSSNSATVALNGGDHQETAETFTSNVEVGRLETKPVQGSGSRTSVEPLSNGKETERERSPFRSSSSPRSNGGDSRPAASILNGSLGSSPQAKHDGIDRSEARYFSVSHIIDVNAAPERINESLVRAAPDDEEINNEPLDPFGMAAFENPHNPHNGISKALDDACMGEAVPEPEQTANVPLIEPITDVAGTLHANGNGTTNGSLEDGKKAAVPENGPSLVEEVPTRRKRRGCCTVQ